MKLDLLTSRQRAVASKASTSVKGYILGGFSFLPVPYAFATAAGLAIVALSAGPTSPFQAIPLASSSLAAPAAATALLGKSGAVLLLIVLFLAVTSAVGPYLDTLSTGHSSFAFLRILRLQRNLLLSHPSSPTMCINVTSIHARRIAKFSGSPMQAL